MIDPDTVQRRGRLTAAERRLVAAAAVLPVLVALVVLWPLSLGTPSTVTDVFVAAAVYGGLLGLGAAFVTVDRLHARQCPACRMRNLRGATACEDCGYDLRRRPRYACTERHEVRFSPGLCDCGRRLQELAVARGIGPEIRFILRAGMWFAVFLLVAGVVLSVAAT